MELPKYKHSNLNIKSFIYHIYFVVVLIAIFYVFGRYDDAPTTS